MATSGPSKQWRQSRHWRSASRQAWSSMRRPQTAGIWRFVISAMQGGSLYHFIMVFGMTQPGCEPAIKHMWGGLVAAFKHRARVTQECRKPRLSQVSLNVLIVTIQLNVNLPLTENLNNTLMKSWKLWAQQHWLCSRWSWYRISTLLGD